MAFGLSAGAIAGIVGAGAAVYSASKSGSGSQPSGTQTQTTQQQLDPRIQSMLFGDGTDANKGLLAQYQTLGQTPQNAGTSAFGNAAAGFLGGQGSGILGQLQTGSNNLLGSQIAAPQSANGVQVPSSGGASVIWNKGATVNAPGQNSTDLTGSYDRLINGNAGANPYLTGALQSAVDQTNTSYQRNQDNLTNTLQRSVLPGIRSNAVLAGQYGGTRQGIAEGNALGDYTNQLTSANLALGQANSANTTGAQAQAFNQGQDRSLAATQSLGAQQYGVAGQNASQAQQAQLQNQSIANNTDQFNVNAANGVNTTNAQLQQQNNQFNAGQQSGTNALNSNNQQAGLAGLSGLLSTAYGYGQNQDNYGINRATQVNGLIAPYLGANGGSTSSAPLYSNPGANILGGATAGLGLYNGIQKSGLLSGIGGGNPYTSYNWNSGGNDGWTLPNGESYGS